MSVAIVTDSTADLPKPLADSHSISIVPLTVIIEGQGYLDGIEISPDEFYRRNAPATTSQPSPGSFAEMFQRLLADHEEVVSLHISARLSGTYAAAVQGAEMVTGGRVRVVDTGLVSMPLGLVTLAAAEMARSGERGAAIELKVKELCEASSVFFVVATLENLRRGGRIGGAAALLGSVLQMKPVLTIRDGQVTPLERVRTQERAIARLVELVRSAGGGRGLCAIVGHAAASGQADRIATEIQDVCDTLLVHPLGPVVGAHAGPGTVGAGVYPAELFPLGLKMESAASAPR
jgi:DegV family protein with EDD domain